MRVLLIDNYDSFTFNLAHALAEITGVLPDVVRNDAVPAYLDGYSAIVISPGPGEPQNSRDFGGSGEVILRATVPVLGVCLGHQGIACAFGGSVVRSSPMHGKQSEIEHADDSLFAGLPLRFRVVRYHSLVVRDPLPTTLRKIAWTDDGTVMALRHVSRPLWGVQFHPESVAGQFGSELLRNFLAHV